MSQKVLMLQAAQNCGTVDLTECRSTETTKQLESSVFYTYMTCSYSISVIVPSSF